MIKERKSWLPHPEAEIHPSMPSQLRERQELARQAEEEADDQEIVCDLGDEEVECWCGATGKISQMFERVRGTCGGSALLNCYCGGDFCVCHNHGEVECPGCEDCESDDNGFRSEDEL